MEEDKINVCYGIADLKGTYSKFAGTSICSVLENAAGPVTIHLIHDDKLTERNKNNFQELVSRYGQEIAFYDVSVRWGYVWNRIWKSMPILAKSSLTIGMLYRLLIVELMPGERRAIYLDADTIVNLDIRELWGCEIPASGLAAVPDLFVQKIGDDMINAGVVSRDSYFNSGVLLLDLKKVSRVRNLIDKVLNFIIKYFPDYPDQDALNYLFPDSAVLPNKYNTFVDTATKERWPLENCIYHYANNSLGLDMNNEFNRLYFRYFVKTPWFDEAFLGNFANNIEVLRLDLVWLCNRCAGKRRIFIGPAFRQQSIMDFFEMGKDEVFIKLEEIKEQELDFKRSKDVILVVLSKHDYVDIRRALLEFGLVEDVDFIYVPSKIGMEKSRTSEYGMFFNS